MSKKRRNVTNVTNPQPLFSGYFSRTRLKCNFTVVKLPLYCTRKWNCNLSCTSALSLLQLPCNGSTGQVPLPEHETFWRNTWYMYHVFFEKFRVPGGGPDQLSRCKEATASCSSNCIFISWYNTIGFLPPWSCTWVAFWNSSHFQTKKDKQDPCNYRGIALSSSLAKNFESILDSRLATFTHTCTQAQYGGKKDHGTVMPCTPWSPTSRPEN